MHVYVFGPVLCGIVFFLLMIFPNIRDANHLLYTRFMNVYSQFEVCLFFYISVISIHEKNLINTSQVHNVLFMDCSFKPWLTDLLRQSR